MTVLTARVDASASATCIRRFVTQLILVILINVPSISFGLAMGWVSLESGSGPEGAPGADGAEGAALVGAAAVTFLAGALAMPAAARALAAGRRPAMLATSAAFIVCWSLKLCGGWGVVVGRAAAGLGGTAAWVIPPMLAVEHRMPQSGHCWQQWLDWRTESPGAQMCSARVRGAAAVALVLAHNVGFLLMYLAADYEIPHRTVLLCCLGLSVVHFIAYLFVPESPAYLAANGKLKEARAALAWCRGVPAGRACAELDAELRALPEPDLEPVSPFRLAKDMLSDVRRRRAFLIALVAVVGQEMCGVLTLLQFAERVFALARDEAEGAEGAEGAGGGGRPASDAVVLGVVQLVASALALYLVEKIGRRPLLVWGALGTALGLCAGAGAVLARWRRGALAALAAAVFADSAGLQPAPYALLAEMFTYQYRGCASLLVTAASDLANALEILVFPGVVQTGGLGAALALAGALTLLLAAFAVAVVPETRHRSPDEIYEVICPGRGGSDDPSAVRVDESERDVGGDRIRAADRIEISKNDDIFVENEAIDDDEDLDRRENLSDDKNVKRHRSATGADGAHGDHGGGEDESVSNDINDENKKSSSSTFSDDVVVSLVTTEEKNKDVLETTSKDVTDTVLDNADNDESAQNNKQPNDHSANRT